MYEETALELIEFETQLAEVCRPAVLAPRCIHVLDHTVTVKFKAYYMYTVYMYMYIKLQICTIVDFS